MSVPDPDVERCKGGFSSGSLPEAERERETDFIAILYNTVYDGHGMVAACT